MSDVDDILKRAERMFSGAYTGYNDYQEATGEDKILELHRTVTFGRSVIFILQKLSSRVDNWNEWYGPRKETLVDDPVCSHLSDLRNKILKEGLDDAVNYTTGELNPADLPPTPDWADRVFIGDRFGGSGYIIEGKDEEELKIYRDFDLPQVETGLYFRNLSDSTDRDDLPTQSVEDDLRYYLRILREIVSDAKSEFGSEDLN